LMMVSHLPKREHITRVSGLRQAYASIADHEATTSGGKDKRESQGGGETAGLTVKVHQLTTSFRKLFRNDPMVVTNSLASQRLSSSGDLSGERSRHEVSYTRRRGVA
jgi:predicted transcriptional regulator